MMRQFTETQRFRQTWILAILILTGAFSLSLGYNAIVVKKLEHVTIIDIIGIVIPILIVAFIMAIKMQTQVDSTGIYYRFFPFHVTMKKKSWDEIARVYVRIYQPLGEYGGWGVRYSGGKAGMALNIAGNQGLQLEFKNGRKLLLGTQKAIELQQVLDELAAAGVISQAKEDRF